MSSDWGKRLAELRAQKAERLAKQGAVTELQPSEAPSELASAIPDESFEDKELPEEVLSADQELERFVKNLGALEAYDKWIGKERNDNLALPEVQISCPNPDHRDSNPSACLNVESKLWICYACGAKGDVLDLAAIGHNMWNEYKTGQSFHNLFREIGKDYGWKVENQNGIPVPVSPQEQRKKAEAAEQRIIEQRAQLEQQKGETPPHNVIDIETGEEVEDDDVYVDDFLDMPSLDWRPLVKEGTFLHAYMQECCNDTSPEEYHFWNGLLALSLAAGRNVQLGRLKANLFICHLGKSGVGKGKSMWPLNQVLERAMPFDEDNPSPDGVFIIDGLQTGEGLVRDFVGEHAPKGRTPVQLGNIKGLVNWDEMSTIVVNSKRGNGNIIKQKLNEFYDCKEKIQTRAAGSRNVAVNPYACLSTSLQPDNLRDGLSKEDVTSGFLNRFFFVTGTRKPQNAIYDYEYDFTKLVQHLQFVQLSYKNYDNTIMDYVPTKLAWSEEAALKWTEFHDSVVDPMIAKGSGSISRVNALMKKLIMLFSINAVETEISLDSVDRALAMWEYIIGSYRAIDSRISISVSSAMANNILEYIQKKQTTVKSGVKYVTVATIKKDRKYDLRDINIALDELLRAGLIERFDGKKVSENRRGRPIVGPCYLPTEVA